MLHLLLTLAAAGTPETPWSGSVSATGGVGLTAESFLGPQLEIAGRVRVDESLDATRGFEFGVRARVVGRLDRPAARVEGLASARYALGAISLGVSAEVREVGPGSPLRPSRSDPNPPRVGVGPGVGVRFFEDARWSVRAAAHWLPVGTTIDPSRFAVDSEVSWWFLTLQVSIGAGTENARFYLPGDLAAPTTTVDADGELPVVLPVVSAGLGVRFSF